MMDEDFDARLTLKKTLARDVRPAAAADWKILEWITANMP